MEQQRKVQTIPATLTRFTATPLSAQKKRKVAGYARVSTDHDDQFTSYEAQIDYYTQYITSHADWEFVKVYPDEGISGLSTKSRSRFNEMVEDALAGKIDLIVTKSVSRFARNTVDSLTTIRKLKDVGCEVYFEKENIFTLDSKAPTEDLMAFLDGEVRYNSLKRANPERAAKLFAKNAQYNAERYEYLNKLITLYGAKED